MALTEADIEQFIEALHENPLLKERVRNAILSDDFLALPGLVAKLAEAIDRLTERMDRQETRLEKVEARLERVEGKLDRVDGRVGNLEGWQYETRYVDRLGSHFAKLLRKASRVVPAELKVLSDAFDRGAIATDDWDDIHLLDVLVHGPSRADASEELWFAVELSVLVDAGDVERAARRAALLQAHGIPAKPAVDGRQILGDAVQRANQLGVVVLVQKDAA